MKLIIFLLIAALVATITPADALTLAEDDAAATAYKSGWKSEGGGTGLRDWTLRVLKVPGADSHAGFFIAESGASGAAIRGKAFGLYANGAHFEAAAAFRSLKKPLGAGQTFSFLIEHRRIEKKGAVDDPATGAIGLTLRTAESAEDAGDYNRGARFEFGCYEGAATYQIYDGETAHDSGIALTDTGLSVSLTLVDTDTYDLEITTLGDRKTVTLRGRKLGGESGLAIAGFCIFNRDGERSDAYFNGFQVTGEVP